MRFPTNRIGESPNGNGTHDMSTADTNETELKDFAAKWWLVRAELFAKWAVVGIGKILMPAAIFGGLWMISNALARLTDTIQNK